MTRINLYPHQRRAIQKIKGTLAKAKTPVEKRLIYHSETGSGKTVTFCQIAQLAAQKNNKCVIFVRQKELFDQTIRTLKEKFEIDAEPIKAGAKTYDTSKRTYVVMLMTYRNKLDQEFFTQLLQDQNTIVVIDEIHEQHSNYLFEKEIIKNCYVIGVTATPLRSGSQRQLGLDFANIVEPTINYQELIEAGVLVDYELFEYTPPDLSNVKYDNKTGDYQSNSLFQAYNKTELYGGLIDNYKQIAAGMKTLIFCCNRQHSILTAKELSDAGYNAKFLVSKYTQPKKPKKTDDEKYLGKLKNYEIKMNEFEIFEQNKHLTGNRDEIFSWLKKEKDAIFCNGDIATTGFDIPDAKVLIYNRAILSPTLFWQIRGRILRAAPDKEFAKILDFGGNFDRFKEFIKKPKWGLWHKESKGGGVAPMKICGYRMNGEPLPETEFELYKQTNLFEKDEFQEPCERFIHASYRFCPFCGFEYPKKEYTKNNVKLLKTKKV